MVFIVSIKSSSALKYANIVFFVLTIVVNSLAGSTNLIGAKNTADVSNAYQTLVTPAGYVFAIWGIIYVLLGVFVVYQALPKQRGKEYQKRIGWLFVLSSIINVAWIFVWQFEILALSVLLIFGLLLTLIAIYVRLGVGKTKVGLGERLAIHLPFSVYLGWITVASIADVAATLVFYNWDGFGMSPESWAIVVVAVAVLITLLMLATRKDVAYSLVIIWALVGIGINHSANNAVAMLTQISAAVVAVAMVITVSVVLIRKRKNGKKIQS
jgi:translocator protein